MKPGPYRADPCGMLMVGLCAGMLPVLLSTPPMNTASSPPPARHSIDPNVAPWWELAALPRIGETSARRIVGFRETAPRLNPDHSDAPVFLRAADLVRVPGVGPRTVARLAPFLHFGADRMPPGSGGLPTDAIARNGAPNPREDIADIDDPPGEPYPR